MFDSCSTRQPLLWAALAFAAGIMAGVYLWRPALWWLLAGLVFLLAAARFRGRWAAWAAVLAAMAAIGAWSIQARDSANFAPDLSPFTDGNELTVTAHVVHDGLLRGHAPWQRQSVDVETETIERDGRIVPLAAGVRLSVYGREENAKVSSARQASIGHVSLAMGEAGRADSNSGHQRRKRSRPRQHRRDPQTGSRPDGGAANNSEPLEDTPDTQLENSTKSTDFPHLFIYGQRLRFPVKLREPRNFQNPGAWDYRGNLQRQGIVAAGSVAANKIELLPGLAGSRFGRWCSRARRSVVANIHRLWPSEQAGLFDAMLIGERSFIGRETTAAWQRSGIYHILVVSGMNVGILAWVIFHLLRRFHAGDVLSTLLTLVLSAGYAYLADLGAPVLRSVLMLSVFLIMRLLYRNRALLNAIGAAALVLLVADPRALFDPSFQLTFLSVVAIAGLALPILERTSEPYRRGMRWLLLPSYDVSQPPRVAQFRIDLRLFAERTARFVPVLNELWAKRAIAISSSAVVRGGLGLYNVVVVSAVAQMAMTLPMAVYFHRATVVGLAANTMAVPLTGILMTTSALALALSYLCMPLAKLPAMVAGWSLSGITWAVNVFGSLRFADLRLPTPELAPCIAAALSLILAMFLVRRRGLLASSGLLLLAASCVWLSARPAQPQLRQGILEVTSIDVGQAESTLIVTPQGRTLLVDAAGSLGPWQSDFDFGENVIAPYLWSRGIHHLDAVLLTHAHSDHMGGMTGVIHLFGPRELWLGPNAESPTLEALRRTAVEHGTGIRARRGGESFNFGGARFDVLAPPPDWQTAAKTRNNDSLVVRVSYGATSALLTGDAEKQIENYLAGQRPAASLLKVGHNGSRTSTTPEFLDAVHPRFAVISVGAHNSFGHPRLEVLQRLRAAHVATYRTDTQGAVSFLLDGTRVTPVPLR